LTLDEQLETWKTKMAAIYKKKEKCFGRTFPTRVSQSGQAIRRAILGGQEIVNEAPFQEVIEIQDDDDAAREVIEIQDDE
jgi:hypothetical protein